MKIFRLQLHFYLTKTKEVTRSQRFCKLNDSYRSLFSKVSALPVPNAFFLWKIQY